jgi:transcription elongation factor Elf1
MRNLNDLKISKKAKVRVACWLNEWLLHFIKQADGRTGNVYRADFVNKDIFYYTDCKDILEKDPEGKSDETNSGIRVRKRMVLLQLFVKTLMGEPIGKKITCTHCGYEDRYIGGVKGGGYIYCKKCGFATINTFPGEWNNVVEEMVKDLVKKGLITLEEKDAIHTEKK